MARGGWFDKFTMSGFCSGERILFVAAATPLILSLSKDGPLARGGWFDRLTMSGFCYGERILLVAAATPLILSLSKD